MANGVEGFERRLDVREVRDDVHEHDVVERASHLGEHLGGAAIGFHEVEMLTRVSAPRRRDRLPRHVDPDSPGGLEGREEVAGPAADV